MKASETMMSRENWLHELPAQVRDAIVARMTTVEIPAGKTLRRTGDHAVGMYQVESGYVRLLGLNPDGRQVLILLYRPGNCFGETPVIARRPFNHTTVALTDVRLRMLAERDFWELYGEFREIPDALCRKFANNTSRQFVMREMRSTFRLRQLISMCFASLADHCGKPFVDGSVLVELPLVQGDFADFLEVTRQAAQREIGALKASGQISQGRGHWLLHNVEGLRVDGLSFGTA